MEVGFIGVGRMGLPMARHLIEAGHKVVAFDTSPEALARAAALGAETAASPTDVADRVETVFASLPTPQIVRAVAAGPNGVIAGKRVRRFVDLSTTGSQVAAEIAGALKAKGIAQVDSPVSGGIAGAQKGTLAVIVSGPHADFTVVEPLLGQFGRVFFVGETAGLAQTMKLANNLLSASALAATAEAMVLAAKAGIDPEVAIAVINAGSGHNTASRDKFPKAILPGTFDFGFATALMLKDVRLGIAEAEALGVPMDVARAVDRLFTAAQEAFGGDSDFTTVIKPLEQKAGVAVRARSAAPAKRSAG
ncbi:MAG TPA: NAD(P)-dependent oxidoreductase [Xanthobacteraceae bacterium]|nr:NAD(P)-dependent oxidoreductase [Xanthobacteraceae bacterium]